MAPGEYECPLEQGDCCGAAAVLRFTRELWSRQFVLKYVAPELLARSEVHALLHPSHVVVSIDSVPVAGLSMRRFTELWIPDTRSNSSEHATTTRVVRFCDSKRAALETTMLKDLVQPGAAPVKTITSVSSLLTGVQQPSSMSQGVLERIVQCQALVWSHKLCDTQDELMAVESAADALILLQLEMELIRVVISNDALVVQQARQVAKQTLVWMQALSDLPSLSRASALVLRVSFAEALLMSSALQLIAEKNVKAMKQLRHCAAVYSELNEQVKRESEGVELVLLPANMLEGVKSRLCFGLGMLQLASATALQGLEWLGAIVVNISSFDPAQALDNLLQCCHDPANPRSAWASLALFHTSGVLRMLQQQDKDGVTQHKYAIKVARAQLQSLRRYPDSVLHLWSASLSESLGPHGSSSLEQLTRAVALSKRDEQAHLLRFDFGYRHFVTLNFDVSTPLFMEICKCASAPSKLRGLCSIFLAASYLFLSENQQSESDNAQLFSSVRLLLRSSLRFLDEVKFKDPEAACLAQRMMVFVNSADWYLHLLPCEILYVYCFSYWSASTSKTTTSNQQQQCLHERALVYLDRFHVQSTSVASMGLLQLNGKMIKLNTNHRRQQQQPFSLDAQAICEWSVLRTSVLFHLEKSESAMQQLETLQELLPQVPSRSFVPALVSFFRLQIYLRRSLDPESRELHQPEITGAETANLESLHFEYSYIYAGKLRALASVLMSKANKTMYKYKKPSSTATKANNAWKHIHT